MPVLSIVLPCYNPLANWHINVAANIQRLAGKLNTNLKTQLIIVNDGSNNNNFNQQTTQYLKQNITNITIIDYVDNRGKGAALRAGVNAATGDYIIYTDIDFPYTDESFMQVLHALFDSKLAIGIRGNSYYQNIPPVRSLISKLLKWFIKIWFNIPTNDTQGGLKGFKKEIKPIFMQTTINRYLFDLEFIYLCSKQKTTSALIPVTLRPNLTMSRINRKILMVELSNLFKLIVTQRFGYK